MSSKNIKTTLMYLAGAVLLLLGVVLILEWWTYLVILFRGVVGAILALAGMIILYMAKEQ